MTQDLDEAEVTRLHLDMRRTLSLYALASAVTAMAISCSPCIATSPRPPSPASLFESTKPQPQSEDLVDVGVGAKVDGRIWRQYFVPTSLEVGGSMSFTAHLGSSQPATGGADRPTIYSAVSNFSLNIMKPGFYEVTSNSTGTKPGTGWHQEKTAAFIALLRSTSAASPSGKILEYRFAGTEAIATPIGVQKAMKFSLISSQQKSTIWCVKGLGPIRQADIITRDNTVQSVTIQARSIFGKSEAPSDKRLGVVHIEMSSPSIGR